VFWRGLEKVEAFAAKPSGGSIPPVEDHFHTGADPKVRGLAREAHELVSVNLQAWRSTILTLLTSNGNWTTRHALGTRSWSRNLPYQRDHPLLNVTEFYAAVPECAVRWSTSFTPWRALMSTGTVKWFNPTKGYGFIPTARRRQDVVCAHSAVEKAGLSRSMTGQQVEFES